MAVSFVLTNTYCRSNPQHVDLTSAPRPPPGNGPQVAVVEGAPNKNPGASQPSALPAKRSIDDVMPSASNSLVLNGEQARKRRQTVADITAESNSGSVLNFTESWMDKKAIVRTDKAHADLTPWAWLSPIASMMPPPARPPTNGMQCQIWEKSNKIYSQISTVPPAAASAALRLNPMDYANLIFKAVINGWASLNTWERSNPIMKALSDIDQVFSELDQVSRAAFLYKSHMLLKVSLKPIDWGMYVLTKFSITWIQRMATGTRCLNGSDHRKPTMTRRALNSG